MADDSSADQHLRSPGQVANPPVLLHQTPRAEVVSFDQRELREILNLYGRMVANGEWRDYAMDFGREKAVFSVFRRAAEIPLYRIEKDPKLRNRQGAYAVIAGTGLIMKRGHDLGRVLQVIDKSRLTVVR